MHAFVDDTEAATLLNLYPASSYSPPPSGFSSQAIAAGALFGDVWQHCAGREIRSAVVDSTAQAPVWGYLFTYSAGPPTDVDGAGHSEDVRYVFQTGGMNQTEAALSERMSDAWIRFADTGDPNEVSEWPQFTTQGETARVFDGDVNQVTYDGYRSAQCDAITNAGIGSEYFFPQATN